MKAKDLKSSILQLAVEGKLVPQDPSDEPASVLLERIRQQKRQLIAEGKAKFPKVGESVIFTGSDGLPYEKRVDKKGRESEPVCITDEVPFEVPESWAWARLEDLCQTIVDCPHSTPQYLTVDTGYVAIDTNCIDDDWHLTGTRNLSKESYEVRVSRYVPQPGDLIFTREGSIGRSLIIERKHVCLGQRVMLMSTDQDVLTNRYCQLVLTSPYAQSLYKAANVGTGVKHINVAMVKALLVPLPPIAEQRRIVAKVDELMPLVDEYGRLEDEREALDAALPDALRKSVLRQAVGGRLVPQDPADEPASELLARIRGERRRLVAEGELKFPKGGESVIFTGSDGRRYEKRVDRKGHEGEPVCIEDEIPFEIPDSWEWTRLESLITLISGTDLAATRFNDRCQGIPYLTGASNFDNGNLTENRWTTTPTRISHEGDLLFTCKGTVGQMAINSFPEAHIARQIMAIVPTKQDMLAYIRVFLAAMVNQIQSAAKGVIPGIERDIILSALIPVPPLAEQHRIIARLDELSDIITSR